MRQEVGKAIEDFRRAGAKTQTDAAGVLSTGGGQKWIVLGLALALSLFGLGIWVGGRLR